MIRTNQVLRHLRLAMAVMLIVALMPTSAFAALVSGGGFSASAVAPYVIVQGLPAGWVNSPSVSLAMEATGAADLQVRTQIGSASAETSAGATTVVSVSAEGTTAVNAWAIQAGEPTGTPSTSVVKIDRTAPAPGSITPTPNNTVWTTNSVVVTATASDTHSGVKEFVWAWKCNGASKTLTSSGATSVVTFSDDGLYTEMGYAIWDNAGNKSATSTVGDFKIDRNAPVTTLKPTGVDGSWRNSAKVTVTIETTDNAGSGINQAWYRITRPDGTNEPIIARTAGSASFDVELAGVTKVAYWAVDKAGNVEATKTASIGIDRTKPTSTVIYQSVYDGISRVKIIGDDKESGIKELYYTLNGGAPTKVSTMTASVEVTAGGQYTLSYWAVDKADNIEATSSVKPNTIVFSVVQDNLAPTTVATASAAGKPLASVNSWAPGEVTVSLVATDPSPGASGVARTWYKIGSAAATLSTGTFKVSAEGTTAIEYWSEDIAGRVEIPNKAVVRIDKTKPSSSFTNAGNFTGTATISVIATDKPSGAAQIKWWVDSGTPAVISAASELTTLTADLQSSVAGTHTISYIVSDFAGNAEATKTATFHVTRATTLSLNTASGNLTNKSIPAATTVSGVLLDAGAAVAGKKVTLLYSTSAAFTNPKSLTATTTATGFSFPVGISDKTYFAVSFDGDADYLASTATTISLTPRAYISTPKAKSTQRANRTFTVTGSIKPAHAKSSKLYIKRYKYSSKSKKYVYVSKSLATITARTGYSSYKSSQKLSKGTWRLYGYMAADSKHASTTSAYLRVVVK